jgi:anti-sigma-K factor RskA
MEDEMSENAALHVLGLLTGDAKTEFEEKLSADPALRAEYRALQDATLALACSAPRHAPPADLREKILADFHKATTAPEPVTAPSPVEAPPKPAKGSIRFLRAVPWAAAAALAVLFSAKSQEAASHAHEVAKLRQANTELAELGRQQQQTAASAAESAKEKTDAALQTAQNDLREMQARNADMEREKALVAEELATLRRDSQLDRTHIAVLKSIVKTQTKALAVSVWRQESQQGLLVVENLPVVAPGRDYQLWILDPNHPTPVSAGVFKVDASGKMRLEFKPSLPVTDPSKFAVTEEKEGGSPTPHLENLKIISG